MATVVPIIKLYSTLVVPIQIELTDALVVQMRDEIAQELRRQKVDAIILEISGLDVFDSFVARVVGSLAQVARLMGVRTLLAGMSAGMAMTLVEMGLELPGVTATLNLETALEHVGYSRPKSAEEQLDEDALAKAHSEHPSETTR